MRISIIGGGRWARIIAEALTGLPGRATQTTMHSPAAGPAAYDWIASKGLGERLFVSPALPDYGSGPRPDAVIVANRAEAHFRAVHSALNADIPVLVEKPLATTRSEVDQLGSLARRNGTVLAASHVFLFARYLDTFADCVAERGGVGSRIDIAWADTTAETRYGEVKSYDALLPITDDILPHILPMLARLGMTDLAVIAVDVRRGGAEIHLRLATKDVTVCVGLARDAEHRERCLEVETSNGGVVLNFSPEPGTISASGRIMNGDPSWDTRPRPLATMLEAFLVAVDGGAVDSRLDWRQAAESMRVADAARPLYRDGQLLWLTQQVGSPLSADIAYALRALGIPDNAQPAFWASVEDKAALADTLSRRSRSAAEARG